MQKRFWLIFSIVFSIVCVFTIIAESFFFIKKSKSYRWLRNHLEKVSVCRYEPLIEKYLFGKNGIEIGGSWGNDFCLYKHGAYLNIDFQLPNWTEGTGKPRAVFTAGEAINVVTSGDDLPFKDETFDYVFNSHVMEHFFDPIKAINEHLRVVKKGGYLVYIIPHVDVIYDNGRDITTTDELMKRHKGDLSIKDYYKVERQYFLNDKGWRKDTGACVYSVLKSDVDKMSGEFFVNNLGEKIRKNKLETFREDDHHHWNVWRPADFIALAKYMGLKVVEYKEKDDNFGNGFVVVIQK